MRDKETEALKENLNKLKKDELINGFINLHEIFNFKNPCYKIRNSVITYFLAKYDETKAVEEIVKFYFEYDSSLSNSSLVQYLDDIFEIKNSSVFIVLLNLRSYFDKYSSLTEKEKFVPEAIRNISEFEYDLKTEAKPFFFPIR
jgi:hypothetical protein